MPKSKYSPESLAEKKAARAEPRAQPVEPRTDDDGERQEDRYRERERERREEDRRKVLERVMVGDDRAIGDLWYDGGELEQTRSCATAACRAVVRIVSGLLARKLITEKDALEMLGHRDLTVDL